MLKLKWERLDHLTDTSGDWLVRISQHIDLYEPTIENTTYQANIMSEACFTDTDQISLHLLGIV